MGAFTFACITPHGGEIIYDLANKYPKRMETTRKNMEVIGKRMSDSEPEALVVMTPHGTRIEGMFSIVDSETMSGEFTENDRTYYMKRDVDRELAKAIYESAKNEHLPIGMLNYGTSSGPLSNLALDWGAMVPLSFMPDLPIVVITPSRTVSNDLHIKLGSVLRQVVKNTDKRVGLIASCDWSHTHDEHGPYGYHAMAKVLDERVVELIKKNKLEALGEFTDNDIEDAKPDGIWQALILAGALPPENRVVEFLSYEAPTYFGLICAAYK